MASTLPLMRWRTCPSKDDNESELFRLIRKRKWRLALDFLALTNIDGEETEEKKKKVEIIRHVDRHGMTALHWACFFDTVPAELIRILLEYFEEAASICDNEGQLPLHIAVSTPVRSSVVSHLLEVYPLAWNLKDKEGHSPIELTLRRRESKRSFKALLEVALMLDEKKVGGISVEGKGLSNQTNTNDCSNLSQESQIEGLKVKEEEEQNNEGKKNRDTERLERLINNNERTTLLHWACSYYVPRELLRQMIKIYGPDVIAQCDDRGWTPLHVAARHAPTEIIDILIQACPAALSMIDDIGRTPLAIACEWKKRLTTIERLSSRKDLAEVVDKDGNTPLHLVFNGTNRHGTSHTAEIVEYLLDTYPGATSVQSKDGSTPLCLACSKNMPSKIVAMLLERDPVQANVATIKGETPLLHATRLKSTETIKLLLKTCPEASEHRDKRGLTCLQEAFLVDPSSVAVELLLGVSPDQVSVASLSDGNTMLHIACEKNSDDIIVRLVECSPKAASIRNKKGMTPLLIAIVKKRSVKVIKALIGADSSQVKVPDNEGNTPLKAFCRRKSISMDTLYSMVSACPEAVTVADNKGRTPLWWLLKKGTINSLPATRLLIRIDTAHIALADNDGVTPLHRATDHGWGEVGHLVRACPRAVAVQDNYGRTPLHHACKGNVPFSVLDDLVDADVQQMSVPDNNGSTPSTLFYQNNHGYVRRFAAKGRQETYFKATQRTLHCDSSDARDLYSRLKLIIGAEDPEYRTAKGASILNAVLRSPTCPSDYFDFAQAMDHASCCHREDGLGELPIHAACAVRTIVYKDFYKCVKCETSSGDSPLYLLYQKNTHIHIPECRVLCGKCNEGNHNTNAYRLGTDDKIDKILRLFPKTSCIPNAHGRLPLFIALEAGRLWDESLKQLIHNESPHLYIQSKDSRTHLCPFMLAAVGSSEEKKTKGCDSEKEMEIKEQHLEESQASSGEKLMQLETVFSLLMIDPTLVDHGI